METAGKREIDIWRRVWNPYSELESLPYGTRTMGQASFSGSGLRISQKIADADVRYLSRASLQGSLKISGSLHIRLSLK